MIVKLSKSGKVVLLIDDSGSVFTLPVKAVVKLCYGGVESFLVPTMMSDKVIMERFPKSKLFIPNGGVLDLFSDSNISVRKDALNINSQKSTELPVGDVVL